jgi:hypothetical protein
MLRFCLLGDGTVSNVPARPTGLKPDGCYLTERACARVWRAAGMDNTSLRVVESGRSTRNEQPDDGEDTDLDGNRGAWLSMWVARCVTETMARAVAGEPVREMVEEALVEHQADDTVMVHAFEEALEDEEAEETANAR